MKTQDLKYKIALCMLSGVGSITAKKLVAYVGSVEGIFSEKPQNLIKIPGIGQHLAAEIIKGRANLEVAEKEMEFLERNKIKTYFYLEKDYPKRLLQCEDAPILFFCKGEVDFNSKKILSIVGTRSATDNGKEYCEKLISDLAERNHNPIIVSGLAFGIDIIAHRQALKCNLNTIAVLAHGLSYLYPPAHKETARQICSQGALISEYLSMNKPVPQSFVRRNRIIAGLSDATIVVESATKGGALVTADIANSYNREVLAFPGRPTDKASSGCNWLIKENKAALMENVEDLEKVLNWDVADQQKTGKQLNLFKEFSAEEKSIIDILKAEGEMNIDKICHQARLPMNKVSVLLLNLEFEKVIKCKPGKVFTLVNY